MDQGAVPNDDPLSDLAGGGFPGEDGAAVEGVEPLFVAGGEVVAPALPRGNGNEVKGVKQALRFLKPPLPRKKAQAPGVSFDFAAQIDELNFGHPISLLFQKVQSSRFKVQGWGHSQIFRV
jgi:hypothetical protein